MDDEIMGEATSWVEIFATWQDGGLSCNEELELMQIIAHVPELKDIVDSLEDVDGSYETMMENGFELPSDLLFDFRLPDIDNSGIFEDEFSSISGVPLATDEIEESDGYLVSHGFVENNGLEEEYGGSSVNDQDEENQGLCDQWSDIPF